MDDENRYEFFVYKNSAGPTVYEFVSIVVFKFLEKNGTRKLRNLQDFKRAIAMPFRNAKTIPEPTGNDISKELFVKHPKE